MKIKKAMILAFVFLFGATLLIGTSRFSFAGSNPGSYIFDVSEGNITISSGTNSDTLKVDYGTAGTVDNIPKDQEITIMGSSTDYSKNYKVNLDISDLTANISLDDLTIDSVWGNAFSVSSGAVTLTLKGTNTLKSSGNVGLHVADDSSLTIQGTGLLTVESGTNGVSYSAGIGGEKDGNGGTITIESGTITAKGGYYGAGIGSGMDATSTGKITINANATVYAASDGSKPAISSLYKDSTTRILMANFTAPKSSSTATKVYLKSDSSLKASFSPAIAYQSIAFSLPSSTATYQLKTADTLQRHGNVFNTDFTISTFGLSKFDSVADTASYTVTINKNGSSWTTGTPEVKLSTSDTSLASAVTGTSTSGVYTFSGLNPSTAYFVWDTTNNQYTGQSLSNSNTSATVNYYTVTLATGAGIESTSGGGTYLSGSNVAIDATVSSGYSWNQWTLISDDASISETKEYAITNISEQISYKANASVVKAAWTDAGKYDTTLYATLISPNFEQTTVEISTPQQLAALARAQDIDGIDFTGVTFELMQNIDLDGCLWDPIGVADGDTLRGAADGSAHPFKGNFDGKGYVISNMMIEGTYVSAGLFGKVGDESVTGVAFSLRNVTVNGTVDVTNTETVAGIVGYGGSIFLQNCTSNAEISATSEGEYLIVGGIVGNGINMVVDGCVNGQDADISMTYAPWSPGMASVGGIAGLAYSASIYNSANFASITANPSEDELCLAGGISGMSLCTLNNCYNTGAVSASGGSSIAGGICGINSIDFSWKEQNDTLLIQNCYNTGAVSASLAGGITGKTDASMSYCVYLTGTASYAYYDYSTSPVTGSSMAGTAMQSPEFCQTLNDWVTANPTSGGDAETGLSLSGIDYQGWIQQSGVNGGYPIFDSDPSDDTAVVPNGSGSSSSRNSSIIIVDGKSYAIGMEKKNSNETIITVDQRKLTEAIINASDSSRVTFPNVSDQRVSTQLVLKNIEDMAQKDMGLVIQSGGTSYHLIPSAIDTESIRNRLRTSESGSIPVDITISKSDREVKGTTLVTEPIEFSIIATYNGQTVQVDTFSDYIDRTVEMTEEQAEKITTAVVVLPDGYLRHVPTKVEVIDGKYYAVINSLTNSTYALIWNPVEFSDMAIHWAKDTVNDMGSRMVVSGVGGNTYDPNRNIARAEFAVIIVRALGLAPGIGETIFTDVASSDWYSDYISSAVSYGLLSGYGDGTFKPQGTITREEAMSIVARAMNITKLRPVMTDSQVASSLLEYEDRNLVSGWAKNEIAANLEAGIITGRTSATICPKENVTRAEVAVIMQKLLQKSELI